MLLTSWWWASWRGRQGRSSGLQCSGLPCGPVGQVQGHKRVATHMRSSSHTARALTPVSPASQGAEAIGQSPGWSSLAQCSPRLWARACLCRPPFPQLEGEGLGWSGQMRPVTPGKPRELLPGQATGAKPKRPLPSPSSRKGKLCSRTGCQARTVQREGQRRQGSTHGHTAQPDGH